MPNNCTGFWDKALSSSYSDRRTLIMPVKGFVIASNKSWVNTRLMPSNLPQSDKNSLVCLFLHWFQWNYHDLWPRKLSVIISKLLDLLSLFKTTPDTV